MSLLSYTDLIALVEAGVIKDVGEDCIGSSSIDIRLGNIILVEGNVAGNSQEERLHTLDYSKRDPMLTRKWVFGRDGEVYNLYPGEFILAGSKETFNLPLDITMEYRLKSSMARSGLQHLYAGYCDPGWTGSVLTLEFKNVTRHHVIQLREGDKIGQMIAFRHAPVPANRSYAVRGSYNNHTEVSSAVAIQTIEDVILNHKQLNPETGEPA